MGVVIKIWWDHVAYMMIVKFPKYLGGTILSSCMVLLLYVMMKIFLSSCCQHFPISQNEDVNKNCYGNYVTVKYKFYMTTFNFFL